jgi:glycosyltransferase involved in cell wall biosynthesis
VNPAPGDGAEPFHLVVYSDADRRGGAEVNLSRVLGALPDHVRVTIVGVDTAVVDWLATHRERSDRMVLPAIESRRDVAGLLRHRAMFRRLRPDVLQFNLSSASSCQWAILAASTLPGVRRVVVENSPMGVWSTSSARLKQATSRRLAAHIAVGDRTGRMIEQSSGLPSHSIRTIYHGVPDVVHEPVDRGQEPTVLTVARHDPVKGVDVLLDAFALVPEPTRLVLIGSGAETAALQEQTERLGLSHRVEFRDLPWDTRAADLMWAFDALVLPSRLEGFPVTIVEAMLAGIPVVATDVGSVDEAVSPGLTGWIVPPEDPPALAAAIEAAVADPAASAEMGDRARRAAEARFTIDSTIEAYLAMYDEVLGRS